MSRRVRALLVLLVAAVGGAGTMVVELAAVRLLARAREPAHDRLAQLSRNFAHGFEVALTGDWEAGLDDVHPELLELARQRELLGQVHAAAR